MWLKWLPWRFIIRSLARSEGFLDPVLLFTRVRRFSQPSEVVAPIELLRTAAVLHARGLINSQAIQYNLDWIWPHWVTRQFDPRSLSFIPRAFSLTHINLTHRNWTAVGIPGFSGFPVVDPAGLVTPGYDGWSMDAWFLLRQGGLSTPSASSVGVTQTLVPDKGTAVRTCADLKCARIDSLVEVDAASEPFCRITYTCIARKEGSLVIAVRPFNPEGISFIHSLESSPDGKRWRVNGQEIIRLGAKPDSRVFSSYNEGDISLFLPVFRQRSEVTCEVGMATAAALFDVVPGKELSLSVEIPLRGRDSRRAHGISGWDDVLEGACTLKVPDRRFMYLYEASLRTLCLHSFQEEMYAGPYTYKHFWFRDACFMLHALCCAGISRVETLVDSFFRRQSASGYFLSQESEWDSNGQVLWAVERFLGLTAASLRQGWRRQLLAAASWIVRKIHSGRNSPWPGLMPAGFSAEHLGPIDYYYWDDFWSAAGLRAALRCLSPRGRLRAEFERHDAELLTAVDDTLSLAERRIGRPAMPASPGRRLDSGVIGSLSCGYPLQLVRHDDRRLLDTCGFILESCMIDGMFFHNMSHSGLNPYLTLHVAQVLLRAGDNRFFRLMDSVARHASDTGQWPEAVHPGTGGGCMGDGQHCWASAEWIMMQRNCFVREEGDALVLCQGIPAAWLETGETMSFGAAPTSFGDISVSAIPGKSSDIVSWKARWRGKEPRIEVRLPGRDPVVAEPGADSVSVRRDQG